MSESTSQDLSGVPETLLSSPSIAGQQETYLNVRGVPVVLDAVKCCILTLVFATS